MKQSLYREWMLRLQMFLAARERTKAQGPVRRAQA